MSLLGFRSRNHPGQTARRGESLFPEWDDVTDVVDDRGTPADWFAWLERRFTFTIDVAASPDNAKCERFYTRADDGLTQSWEAERVWCNPPFSDIRPWVAKAHESHAELVVMLLPANRTEQAWWQDLVEPFRDRGERLRTEFLPGRPRFVQPLGETRSARPPFGCCLLIWVSV